MLNHYRDGWIPLEIGPHKLKCQKILAECREYNKTSELKIIPVTISYSLPKNSKAI